MFEETWRNWGRAVFLGVGAAVLAAVGLLGGLEEGTFALVALVWVTILGAGLLVVDGFIQLSGGGLRLGTILFCLLLPVTGMVTAWDVLVPGPAVQEASLRRTGDALEWAAPSSACFLVQVYGHPGVQRGGGDKRIELEVNARRGSTQRDLEFALFKAPSTGLKGGKKNKISQRLRDLKRVVLQDEGPVRLRLTRKKPSDAAPVTITVHEARVPLPVSYILAGLLLALSLLLAVLAARDGERSLTPVAGIAAVVFTFLGPRYLVPSGVLLPLGGALLISSVAGGVIGLLVSIVIEKAASRTQAED